MRENYTLRLGDGEKWFLLSEKQRFSLNIGGTFENIPNLHGIYDELEMERLIHWIIGDDDGK